MQDAMESKGGGIPSYQEHLSCRFITTAFFIIAL